MSVGDAQAPLETNRAALEAVRLELKEQEDALEQKELRQTQLAKQAQQAGAGLVDEIKQLCEEKARLEAENQQQALALQAIRDAEVQALQQAKLQLEDDIRKASHANEVAETAKMAEQRDLQAEDIVQADQVEQEQLLSQNSMDAPTLHPGSEDEGRDTQHRG